MEVYINGKLADFPDNEIQYVINSPIFQDIGGEAALELQFPLTTTNKEIFGYAHRPEHAFGEAAFHVVIKAGGMEKQGTGILRESGSDYKLSVGFEKSDFYHKIKDLTLRDLPFCKYAWNLQDLFQGVCKEEVKIDTTHKKKEAHIYEVPVPVTGLWMETHTEVSSGCIDMPDGYVLQLSGAIKNNVPAGFSAHCMLLIRYAGNYGSGRKWGDIWKSYELETGPVNITVERGNDFSGYRYLSCSISLMAVSVPLSSMKYRAYAELIPDSNGVTLTAVLRPAHGVDVGKYGNAPYPEGKFVLATVYNPELLSNADNGNIDEANYKLYPVINHYQDGRFPDRYELSSKTHANLFVPFPYVAYVFDLIVQTAGYRLRRNIFVEEPELGRLVLYNNFVENKIRADLDTGAAIEYMPVGNWDLQNHVSDMALTKFIGILKLFGAAMFVDSAEKMVDILFLKDILSGPIGKELEVQFSDPVVFQPGFDSYELTFEPEESFASDNCVDLKQGRITYYEGHRPHPPRYNDVWKAGRMYFRYMQKRDEENKPLNEFFLYGVVQSPFSDATEESKETYKVECPLGPMFAGSIGEFEKESYYYGSHYEYEDGDLNTVDNRLTAYAEDTGIFPGTPEETEDYPVMALSFYRGLVDGVPTLSHDIYYTGVFSYKLLPDASIALRWEDENGLYQTFWKSFLDWLTKGAKKAKIKIPILSMGDFLKLKTSYRVRINQQNYLIDSIQAKLGDRVTDIEIEAYTC